MIAAVALAHAAKPRPFNADFFTVAATVIPVLFLAIAVQGATLDDIRTVSARVNMRSADRFKHETRPRHRALIFIGAITLTNALWAVPSLSSSSAGGAKSPR